MGKRVLIVAHGAVVSGFMREVMHLDPMFDPSPVVVPNTSMTKLQLVRAKGDAHWATTF